MKDFEYQTHNYFEPVPRTRFFKWIADRHLIYQKRCSGVKPPWTEDTILRDYKFTNPFRENDYVTIWMRENWTNPNKNKSFELSRILSKILVSYQNEYLIFAKYVFFHMHL